MKRLLAFLLALWCATPAFAAITPTSLGVVNNQSSTAQGVLYLTGSTTAPAGQPIFAFGSVASNTATAITVSDTAGNTYTSWSQSGTILSNTERNIAAYVLNPAALPVAAPTTGSTVTGCAGACVLTVGTLTSGVITVGQQLVGTSLAYDCHIASNISGSGNGSTWNLSGAGCANVGSEAITMESAIVLTWATTGIANNTLSAVTTSGLGASAAATSAGTPSTGTATNVTTTSASLGTPLGIAFAAAQYLQSAGGQGCPWNGTNNVYTSIVASAGGAANKVNQFVAYYVPGATGTSVAACTEASAGTAYWINTWYFTGTSGGVVNHNALLLRGVG